MPKKSLFISSLPQIVPEPTSPTPSSEPQYLEVLCGNDKLLNRYGIDLDFNNFRLNI